MSETKINYVDATFNGKPTTFFLSRKRIEVFEIGLQAGSAYEFLRRLLNGTWTMSDLVQLLTEAHRDGDGKVTSNSHGIVMAAITKNGPGHYVGLAAKIIEAALFGVEKKDAVFDEAKQLAGEAA